MSSNLGQVARRGRWIATVATVALAASAMGQTVPDQTVPDTNLDLPSNLQIFGKLDPNIRKPTAVVNDAVITGTDVDQRVALIAIANQAKLTGEEHDRLKLQVLRALIDEALEIQEAKANDITITSDKVNDAYGRVAGNFHTTAAKLGPLLRDGGSSERALKRQIEGELAWQQYLRRKIDVNISDAEVKATIDRLKAQQGTDEYEVREIYLHTAPATEQQCAPRCATSSPRWRRAA